MESYLVTGGAGFIGSHLVEALLRRNATVVAVDNLATGASANLASVADHPNFRFVAGSILDEPLVDELVNQCEVVVHLAATVGVRLIVEQPLRSFTNNVRGSEVVIGAAHRYRRKILDREHIGDLRKEWFAATEGRGRSHSRSAEHVTLGLQHGKGGGRGSRLRLPPGAWPARDRGPAFQHSRTPTELGLRDGAAGAGPPSLGGSTIDCLWRRSADTMFLPRR